MAASADLLYSINFCLSFSYPNRERTKDLCVATLIFWEHRFIGMDLQYTRIAPTFQPKRILFSFHFADFLMKMHVLV